MERFKKLASQTMIVFIILFVIIMLNQIVSIYKNLSDINVFLGAIVAIAAFILLILLIGIPIYGIMKYPTKYAVPEDLTGAEYMEYKKHVIDRLKRNKILRSMNYDYIGETDEEIISNAHARLKNVSLERIKSDANAVFLTTAISQNGVLDGSSVIFTLGTMVYKIVEIYENRPDLSRLLHIYSQIASVVLIAGSIEDMDLIEEQLEPVLTSLLGSSIISAIPGAVGVTTLIMNSMVEGSVNALLTLRVGIVADRYLSSTDNLDKATLRKGAFYEATGHLGSIIANNGVKIVKSITNAAKKATIDKITNPFTRKKDLEEI